MKRLALFAVLMLLVPGTGCSTGEADVRLHGLDISVDGGLTGRGGGRLGIRDRELVATDAAGRVCTSVLEQARFDEIESMVSAIDGSLWGQSWFGEGADFFTYTLSVESDRGLLEVSWNDGATLPEQFQPLVRTLWETKQEVLSGCGR